MLVGCIAPLSSTVGSENIDNQSIDHTTSQTSEYPPFVSPASNATTLISGSIFVNGQELFWRYFTPNTSLIQPKNFRFSFEIWWNSPDPDIVVVVDLSENEGDSNSTKNYPTTLPYEEILEDPEGDFIHYSVWMNTTYFFANETWASFTNELIDEESLNLTVGIQHTTYSPIFEYTIFRDTSGPSIEIIHPNYDESENTLTLDWSNTSFEVRIRGLRNIRYVKFAVTFVNLSTFELDEVISRPMEVTQDEETGILYVPSLITEKYNQPGEGGGIMDIDTDHPVTAGFVVVDGYGYATSKSMTIILDMPYSSTTPTTTSTTIDWETMIPLVGTLSVVGIVAILLVRSKKTWQSKHDEEDSKCYLKQSNTDVDQIEPTRL
jgi:hypothetical protein